MKNSDYTNDQVTRWRRYIDRCLLISWKTVIIIAVVWLLSVGLHKAMYGPFCDYFVPKDCLSSGVSGILQDENGVLWQTFTIEDGLADNDVSSILQDKDGNLWFGTYGGGVSRYDGAS